VRCRGYCGGAPRRLLLSVDFGGFQRFSTSITHDWNRGIIAGFFVARHTSLLIIIHIHISLNNRSFVACFAY